MNEPLNKQSSCKWFETLWHSCDITVMKNICHDMEMLSFFALLALCEGMWSPAEPIKQSFDVFFVEYICGHTVHPMKYAHCNDVIMRMMASQITSPTIVYSTVYSGTDQRKHQSSVSLAFEQGIHQWPVNSPQKRASNTENISILWRHHEMVLLCFVSLWLHYQLIMQPFYAVFTMVIASTSWRVQLSLKIIICLITWRKTLPSALMT